MKGWIRIALITVVLIGSASLFGYWSVNQLNATFNTVSATYLQNTSSVYLSLKHGNAESASTSPETAVSTATSTDLQQNAESASTSPKLFVSIATSTDPKISFIFPFPQKDAEVYIGCIYPISWQASTTIRSFRAELVDAVTRDTLEPKTSGLTKENTIEKGTQNLDWGVEAVRLGSYYIKISKVNAGTAVARSGVFMINKMSGGISANERENICKESGGLF